METENAGMQPPATEGERRDDAMPVNHVVEERRVPRELTEDRYRLKAPTFTGEEEVEQFIQEFCDVMDVAQWPPRVALLKLRMSLMDKAKPYGLGADIDSIFASLRARFGISATDARARLQRLWHDLHTPLQEHAAMVMKLAQIAYSDLPQANRERYTLDAFIQSVNDLGLHHQFLARGVTTVEDALAEGEAYLLANQMHKSRGNSRQVEVDRANTAAEREAVATDPKKVRAIEDWVTPQDLTGLRAFLGLVGYYRQYIPDFAGIAQPLNRLTAKGVTWQWSPVEQRVFDRLKGCLLTAPILAYPDPTLEYILNTDASDQNVSAVLSQVQEGREVVVAYYSKSLSPTEQNYCTTRKELLAVIKSVKHFRPYLYSGQFRLRTDHASLIWCAREQSPPVRSPGGSKS